MVSIIIAGTLLYFLVGCVISAIISTEIDGTEGRVCPIVFWPFFIAICFVEIFLIKPSAWIYHFIANKIDGLNCKDINELT